MGVDQFHKNMCVNSHVFFSLIHREDKVIAVESRPNPGGPSPAAADDGVNLYTLAGHESTY